MSAEGDNVTHYVEGVVSELRQQGLFFHDTNGESVGKKVRYRIGGNCLVEFDVAKREHRWQHPVGSLCEG